MDLDDCYKKGLIRKTVYDQDLIDSLLEMSDIKQNTVNNAVINGENISAYVSMAYESLREVLEAFCISKGYKVLSHICIGVFIKDKLDEFDYDDFDRVRYIRNSINYYGEKIDYKQGKDVISMIFQIKKKILFLLLQPH